MGASARASIKATMLSIFQRVGDRPADIAGEHRSVLWIQTKLVKHRVEANHVIVRLGLLGEGIRQPREAPHPHPEIQVLPLSV